MSSHWSHFSKEFRISQYPNGIVRIYGAAFGESDRKPSFPGLLLASTEILLKTLFYFSPKKMFGLIRWGRPIVKSMGLYFGTDAYRQLCVLSVLKDRLPQDLRRILVIGDGPGILSAFLSKTWPEAEIVLVDLGATLAIQAQNLTRAFPQSSHWEGFIGGRQGGFRYVPAERLFFPDGIKIDLAVNVASMQEMKPETVKQYFQLLRSQGTKSFYCCNRLEKVMPGGEVARLADYPWRKEDQIIVDGKPAWYGWFLGTGGLPVVSWGPFQLPLLRRYDGVHAHRFIRMASS